jgi:predicted PurR-regulated permease PerM
MSTQTDTQEKPQRDQTQPNAAAPDGDVLWVRVSPSQVVRTVIIALLTAAAVLGALYLLWHVRSFLGWFVIALFLAAVLNPVVNWLERRHTLIKRSLAILLTYMGLVVALVFMVGILLPVLADQIEGLVTDLSTDI